MFMSKQIIRFILCIFIVSVAAQSTIDAYPCAYRRLILKQDGKIVKIIDLISDYHVPEIPNNPYQLGLSEKSMLEALRRIGNKKDGGKVGFFGESKPEFFSYFSYLNYPGIALSEILLKLHYEFNENSTVLDSSMHLATSISLLTIPFFLNLKDKQQNDIACSTCVVAGIFSLWQFATRLPYIFGAKNKNLIYSHADCYRDNLMQNWKNDKIRTAADYFKHTNPIDRDLNALKQIVDVNTYNTLGGLWSKFKQVVINRHNGPFPFVDEDCAFYSRPLCIVHRAMDFEVIMKLFSSKYKHNIVYAGGWHCDNLSNWLVNHFNFTLIRAIGSDSNTANPSPLPPSLWAELESYPQGFAS